MSSPFDASESASEPAAEATVDRLEWLLRHFPLRASVFQAGPLAQLARFEPQQQVGYLHLLHSGGVRVLDQDEPEQRLEGPCIFVYLNPTQTIIEPESSEPLMVCASFEFGLGAGNPLQAALPRMQHLSLAQAPGLASVMHQIQTETTEPHCGRLAILNRLSEVALVLMLRELMDQQGLDVGLLAGLADRKLHKALTAIHAQPQRGWQLPDMARAAGMSRARFAVRFREVVGLTPAAYLAEWRVGLAQSMLLQGQTLPVIADAVGYGSATALSRAFLQRRNVTPRQWLRAHAP